MKKAGIAFALMGLCHSTAGAMNLQEFLQQVETKNKSVQALEASIEASEARRASGDLELSPVISFDATHVDDKKSPNQMIQFGGTESKITQYSLGLEKKFSTGTAVGLSAKAAEYENVGVNVPANMLPPGTFLDKYGTGSLGISISQSLWKDFFGNSTRLRWERETQAAAAARENYNLQKRLLLISAEATYWDYIYAQEEQRIQLASLERSKRIEQWTTRRVQDGISDRADLLQTQALVARRQLQLLMSRDQLQAVQKRVRDMLELGSEEPLPNIQGDLSQKRSISAMVGSTQGKIVQLEAYVAALNAKASAAISASVEDNARPDLVLRGAYNTNGYDATMPRAVQKWDETDRPTTTVGLNFRYVFDTDAKSSSVSAARKDALAAKLTSERKMLESESAWGELLRRYNELGQQIEAAQTISQLQTNKAKAQIDKFNKGRSITTDVVNAEQDAAEAELSLSKMKSEQRKLEAQGRVFVAVEGSL